MSQLFLAEPSLAYENEYIEMIQEWKQSESQMVPWVLHLDYEPFPLLIQKLYLLQRGSLPISLQPAKISTFWLVDNTGKIYGVSNIQHSESISKTFGHIGYGIRPSARNKGYGKTLLQLTIEKARELNMPSLHIVCHYQNHPSQKVVLANGGRLNQVKLHKGALHKYFVIEP